MSSRRTFHLSVGLILGGIALVACSNFQGKSQQSFNLARQNNFDEAIKVLQPEAEKEGDDQLVYLMEYGMVLHLAKRYDESIQAFLKADRLSEIKDYHSLSRIVGSLALNEGMIQYKGEDFEKILINVYLALNYLMKNDLDNALVEVRRINEKLNLYRMEAKREYSQSSLARYLGAMIFESNRDWDDSYIDYKNTYKIRPAFGLLKEDLLRSSRKAQRMDDFKEWQGNFPDVTSKPSWTGKDFGEIVLIYQQGRGPVKKPDPNSPRMPMIVPRRSLTERAELRVQGFTSAMTETIYSVDEIAAENFREVYSELALKRVAGVATKYVIAKQVSDKNELLGALTWIGLNIADQADLRQWASLPASFQIARIPISAGNYLVDTRGLDGSGNSTGENMPPTAVVVKPGKKVFVTWRSFN